MDYIERSTIELRKSPFKNGKWRFCDTFLLLNVVRGEIAFRSLKKTVWVKAGELLFLSPSILYSLESVPESSSIECLVIRPEIFSAFNNQLSEEILKDLLTRPELGFVKATSKSNIGRQLVSLFSELFKINNKTEYPALYESIKTLEIIHALSGLVIGKKQRISKRPLSEKKLAIMLRYIDDNLQRQITMKDLGLAAEIKERECLRIFQDLIHISPGQYIMQRRLDAAESMLSSAQVINTSEVAKKCGFVSLSYFIKLFKRAYGKTPGQYVLEASITRNSDNPLDALSDFFG